MFLAILPQMPLHAEIFHLKNGEKIEGKIIQKNQRFLKIKTKGRIRKILRKDIQGPESTQKDLFQDMESEHFLNACRENNVERLKAYIKIKPSLLYSKNTYVCSR
jgi:hypothetical protein